LSVLNRYFEILKWQNLASYLKPISVWSHKTSFSRTDRRILLQMALANTPEKHCIMKNRNHKSRVPEPICNGIQMVLTVIEYLVVVF
jgi:hypothetical protein